MDIEIYIIYYTRKLGTRFVVFRPSFIWRGNNNKKKRKRNAFES